MYRKYLQHLLYFTSSVKAAVRSFFGVKNYPKYIFEKIAYNQQCPKLSACLSLIQSGKLVVMFLIPVVLMDFHGRFEHIFALLHHICTHKKGVLARISYIVCEDVEGGDLYPILTALDINKLSKSRCRKVQTTISSDNRFTGCKCKRHYM